MARIGVIFDFDDTLAPDSTTALVDRTGHDVGEFWSQDVDPKVQDGWDPTLAWMDEFIRSPKFAELTHAKLVSHGKQLEPTLYPGVDKLFPQLKEFGDSLGVELSTHIVSSGLLDVIAACSHVAVPAESIHACTFAYTGDGRLSAVKRALTFTEKTRALFEISKGIDPSQTAVDPYLVNERHDVAIPFQNMIYIGDGLTDIPAFSLVEQHGGVPIGVDTGSRSRKAIKLVDDQRVHSMAKPDYSPGSQMRSQIERAITTIADRANQPTEKSA